MIDRQKFVVEQTRINAQEKKLDEILWATADVKRERESSWKRVRLTWCPSCCPSYVASASRIHSNLKRLVVFSRLRRRATEDPANRLPLYYICPSLHHQHTFRLFKCVEICNLFSCLRYFCKKFFFSFFSSLSFLAALGVDLSCEFRPIYKLTTAAIIIISWETNVNSSSTRERKTISYMSLIYYLNLKASAQTYM